ncbi:MAG: glycosyltransferase family 10 [Planctomycetaceae bacterium]|nr:glycosyltransferase family 10 [Planctomycetaceae bacterium]
MKPRLKIAFADYSRRSFRPEANFITRALEPHYELELSDDPHVVFYSWRGHSHRRFRSLRVFVAGENLRPNWRHCDYAIGYDRTDNPDYFRQPSFARGCYGDLHGLVKGDVDPGKLLAEKTAFCNFICSNANCRERVRFFDKLSRYRRVDSPGKVRNNMQGALAPRHGQVKWFKAKADFIRRYKFTIAFENSSHPGYTTEKLPQPMWADSLPIYWGDPLVHIDFNPRSFLNYFDYGSHEALIERIIEVDQSDDLYAQYLRQPWYHENRLPDAFEPSRLSEFLCKVVETLRQPVAQRSWLSRFFPLLGKSSCSST